MAGAAWKPDPTEAKVLDGLVARGIAPDRNAATRIAVLIAGAAVGILDSGPGIGNGGAGGRSGQDEDALEARETTIGASGKTSVASSVAALKALAKKGPPRR